MLKNIPPQIFWPGMVIGILSMSFVANMILLYNASTEGGPQIIEDYYDKAANWDEVQAKQAQSDALGWQTTITLKPVPTGQEVTVKFVGPDGQPIAGIQPKITAFDIRKIAAVGHAQMQASQDGFVAELPIDRDGLWDLVIEADSSESHFYLKKRVDVRSR